MSYNYLNAPKDCDFLRLGEEESLLFEKQHAYPGPFRMKTKKGRVDFELTEQNIKNMATESQRYIDNGNQCNLPTSHTNDVEANRGKMIKWFTRSDSKGRLGLFSLTEFRDKEAAKLAKTAQTSIYAPGDYEDGAKNTYVRPVIHVALTDYPVIPGLDKFTPIAASLVSEDKDTIMPIKDLAAKIGLKLSEDVLSDEALTLSAIQEAFEELKTSSVNDTRKIALELSEYKTAYKEYKKLNPVKSDPVHVSKAHIKMLRDNRTLALSSLVEKGKILTCVKTKLEEIFCRDAGLTLCLSNDDSVDDFDEVIDALRDNDGIKLSEIDLPNPDDVGKLLDAKHNPLIANAMKTREKILAAQG